MWKKVTQPTNAVTHDPFLLGNFPRIHNLKNSKYLFHNLIFKDLFFKGQFWKSSISCQQLLTIWKKKKWNERRILTLVWKAGKSSFCAPDGPFCTRNFVLSFEKNHGLRAEDTTRKVNQEKSLFERKNRTKDSFLSPVKASSSRKKRALFKLIWIRFPISSCFLNLKNEVIKMLIF